jgi:hypothetical protein
LAGHRSRAQGGRRGGRHRESPATKQVERIELLVLAEQVERIEEFTEVIDKVIVERQFQGIEFRHGVVGSEVEFAIVLTDSAID